MIIAALKAHPHYGTVSLLQHTRAAPAAILSMFYVLQTPGASEVLHMWEQTPAVHQSEADVS